MKHILKMKYPSSWWHDLWREGLVTGNGFTGASLYGGAKREILQLSRHDFWIGGEQCEVPDVHEAFHRMRRKMDQGNFREASWEIVKELKARGYASELEEHVPMARMVVEQVPLNGFRDFSRSLDLEKAVASQQWTDARTKMRREVFVSRAVDMVVYRLSAMPSKEPDSSLCYTLGLEAYRNEGQTPSAIFQEIWDHTSVKAVCGEEDGYLYFNSSRPGKGVLCEANGEGGRDFGAVAKVHIQKGKICVQNNCLSIQGAGEVLITIKLYADGRKEKAWEKLHDELAAIQQSFDGLLAASSPLHSALYHSAEFSLGDTAAEGGEKWGKSNEELVMDAFADRQSPELIEKLWHYGRYLFICGTNPFANPFPLYGLWNGSYQPIWCHNMANENLQMIYWHSFCGNLTDYNHSVFRYMNDRIPDYEKNACKLFGLRGIYMTAGTTPGVASPTQVVPVIINWVGAAGWIAQQYYQHFMYTRDQEFARKTMLPYMDGVARFYEDFVRFKKDETGAERILFYPSVSPENTPENFMPQERYSMAHPMPTTINSTIDLAILKEFFTEMLDIRERVEDSAFSEERVELWHRILQAIPRYGVNDQGAVREWQEDIFKDRYDHRHLSHIYPVFPGYEYYAEKDPEKIPAFRKAVKLRRVDAQTGWSMAHMAAVYARFREGNAAMECLDNMARSSLLNNFFTLHNDWRGMNISLNMDPAPVQLDAVMGYVNAVQEMLLYAAPGYIALLPALEERLFVGEVKNFRYHDGLISMKWDVEKASFEARIQPVREHTLQIVLPAFVKEPEWSGIISGAYKLIRPGVWEVALNQDSNVCCRCK